MYDTTPLVTAHVRREGAGVSFRHIRCGADQVEHRAAITAAADFIFPYATPSTTPNSPGVKTKRRPRSAIDYRDLSPSLASMVTSSSSSNDSADSGISANSKSSRGRRLREKLVLRRSAPTGSTTASSSPNARRAPHTFAITHKDGSRLFCFVKLLSSKDALLIITSQSLGSFYIDVLERTGCVFYDTQPMLNDYNTPASVVAACCVRSLTDTATSEWLTAYAHSLSSLPATSLEEIAATTDEEIRLSFDSGNAGYATPAIAPSVAATLHALADSSAVSHIPPRMLVCMLAALMDERRVAVVGRSVPVVSRVVLALWAMLTPFEWPHLFSPVLPRKHAAVLDSPFPFLVGIEKDTLKEARSPNIDGVLFFHLDESKLEAVGDEFADLWRCIPRGARARLERRLMRARHTSNSAAYNEVVQRGMEKFFGDVLNGTVGDTDVARRHRSFGPRKSGLGISGRGRLASWGGCEEMEPSCGGLAARFRRTQMYMAWADEEGESERDENKCPKVDERETYAEEGTRVWPNWGVKGVARLRQSLTNRM